MNNKKMNITYESSVTNIVSVNSSFDMGVLKVAYTGLNRNNSFISEETFEKCIKTIYNCPVVCNYNRETDSIGSHDIEIVKTDDNKYKVINVTQPVGLVPESAKYWWEDIVDDGVSHRYLCVEVILWKRQEAYEHIKDNKVIGHSMEIDIVDGNFTKDGYYNIDEFIFTAFCLLESAEPCFESSALHMFSLDNFKEQYSLMMKELKQYSITENNKKEGGMVLNEEIKNSILGEFNLTLEDITFEITEEMTEEEFRLKLEEFTKTEPEQKENEQVLFSATYRQKRDAISNALTGEVLKDANGNLISETSYWVSDFDDTHVFVEKDVWTANDYNSTVGRFAYIFDATTLTATITSEFEEMVRVWLTIEENNNLQAERAKYDLVEKELAEYKGNYSTPNSEVAELQKFKDNTLNTERKNAETALFEQFEEELSSMEEYSKVKENSKEYSIEQLSDKLYALLGKKNATFSAKKSEDVSIKVPLNAFSTKEDPYGGLLAKYYEDK